MHSASVLENHMPTVIINHGLPLPRPGPLLTSLLYVSEVPKVAVTIHTRVRPARCMQLASGVCPATTGLVNASSPVILGSGCTWHSLWSQKSVRKQPKAINKLLVWESLQKWPGPACLFQVWSPSPSEYDHVTLGSTAFFHVCVCIDGREIGPAYRHD
jgi:hypothetical protein